MRQMVGVDLGFIGVDWEVDWGAVDMMLSLIVPEVTGLVSIAKWVLQDVTR